MTSADDPMARMCYRKKAMPENHARQVVARAKQQGSFLHAYQCPACSMWHVTNDFDQDGNSKVGRYRQEGA